MYKKTIISKNSLMKSYLEEIIQILSNIINLVDSDLPICKKHSAIYASHYSFDYFLSFIKNYKPTEKNPIELICYLDKINLYLISIMIKRLYVKGDQNLARYYVEIKDKFKQI